MYINFLFTRYFKIFTSLFYTYYSTFVLIIGSSKRARHCRNKLKSQRAVYVNQHPSKQRY